MTTCPDLPITSSSEQPLEPKSFEQLALEHPLRDGSIQIATPPVIALYKAIKRFLLTGVPGVCFTAPSSAGKSSAIAAVVKMLKQAFPKLLILVHNTDTEHTSSTAFFRSFLASVGHATNTGSLSELRARIHMYIQDLARFHGTKNILLVVDEAQALTIADFRFLKDLFNNLEGFGIRMTTVMLAQEPQFTINRNRIGLEEHTDLMSRFMMQTADFQPLRTIEDLTAVLKGIDENVFPADSDVTWPAFYVPQAVGAGFKLEPEVSKVFNLLSKLKPQSAELKIPARQLFWSVAELLIEMSEYDSDTFVLPSDAWSGAFKRANIALAMDKMHNDYQMRSPIIEISVDEGAAKPTKATATNESKIIGVKV